MEFHSRNFLTALKSTIYAICSRLLRSTYPRPSRLRDNARIALAGTWCAPGIREGGGAGSVALRWRGWVMNPQVRALVETSGSGRVLHQGKNAGGARETGPRIIILRGLGPRPASRLLLPWRAAFFDRGQTAKAGRGNGEACPQSKSKRAMTGTWSEGRSQPRASRNMSMSFRPGARLADDQMWSRRRPRSDAAQSAAR